MKNIRPVLFVLILALTTLFATNAMAQSRLSGTGQGGSTSAQAYYTGYSYSRAELISLGTYDTPPVAFVWDVLDVSQTPVNSRMDFVLTLDADVDTVIGYFDAQSKKKQPVASLQPNILSFVSDRDLIILGRSINETPARFTLGGAGTHTFVIDVSADGAKTKVVLMNSVRAHLFSGVVPPRAPLTPVGANPVGFLWN
ncbi:hypothetical protein [Bradymonas sediminis]|uniref:Uncharacterized protein n=1 Tax=Bradymonas sediminis TaxID=1548548 RepID=A0A2Z4FRB6_9DELT|nr:hypothetical protein [Bradymonas sediminis]AWV91255.1 hypothetical protein DN745_18745 [Bradymonas sediminis]TDP73823.1 hypothetical protein DFR33_105155 [Bradymonas sediminis]